MHYVPTDKINSSICIRQILKVKLRTICVTLLVYCVLLVVLIHGFDLKLKNIKIGCDKSVGNIIWLSQWNELMCSNNVRMTRSAALQVTDGTSTANVFLGRRDRDFTFDDLRPMTIQFVECFARTQKNESEQHLEPLKEWLAKVA